MNKLVASLGIISVVVFAGAASAADLPLKAAPMATPSYSWTGFYVGGNVGGGWGSDNNINYVSDPAGSGLFFAAGGTPNVTSINTSGAVGGGQLGYNWQFSPKWVAGLEADFDWSGLKGNGTGNTFPGAVPFLATAGESVNWFGTARARLGYLPTNNLLAFVTGGFAYGQVNHSAAYINNSGATNVLGGTLNCFANSTCLAGSSGTTAGGWTAGGGLEYAVTPKWTIKAEYLYVSLRGNSVTETSSASTSFIITNFGHTNFNVARVGANFHF
jgi:outer membrane immunogenic protein